MRGTAGYFVLHKTKRYDEVDVDHGMKLYTPWDTGCTLEKQYKLFQGIFRLRLFEIVPSSSHLSPTLFPKINELHVRSETKTYIFLAISKLTTSGANC